MSHVLSAIVATKHVDVAARRASRPLHAFRGACVRSTRGFEDAVAAPGLSLIAEIKARSPSEPSSAPAFDPAHLARTYDASARAVSVLTDTPYFGGSHAHLAIAREHTRRPLLCKDFVVDPDYQIPEAREAGADSILLMAQVLDVALLEHALAVARDLAMEPLVECHDERELDSVLTRTSARIVGINARDLGSLAIDLERPRRLAAQARDAGVLVVAESGLRRRDDVLALEGEVDAILVGTAIARASSPLDALCELGFPPRPLRPAIKLCGMRTREHVQSAYAAGATHVGLNFVPGARRRVALAEAAAIARENVPVRRVGVFRSPSPSELVRAHEAAQLHTFQLHGDVDLPGFATLAQAAGVQLLRAVSVGAPGFARDLAEARELGVDLLLDGPASGSGAALDARALRGRPLPRAGLAGGLDATNVGPLVARFEPAMVDVASGIELDGEPAPARMRAFVDAVHRASPRS